MNILQLHYLSSILQGKREMTEIEAVIRAKKLGLYSLVSPFLVAEVAPYYGSVKAEEKDLIIRDCADYVGRYLKKAGLSIYFIVNEYDNVQIIISHVEKEIETKIEKTFIDIHDKLLINFGLESFIGIGSTVQKLTEISTSSHDATEMLAYKYSYAEQGVVNIKNLIRFSHSPNYSSNIRFDRVIGCFQDGNIGKMAQRLDEMITDIRNRPNVSPTAITHTFVELTVTVLHVAANADVNTDEILHGLDIYQWILEQQQTEILIEWFIKLCGELLECIQKQRNSTEKSIIQSACLFVDENIDQTDLGLSEVSASAGLSPFYFSKLFKKEKGIGLNNYISGKRIAHAKKLLTTTDLLISDVALQSGFSTSQYFSQVFKKTVGKTPGEYRRSTKN